VSDLETPLGHSAGTSAATGESPVGRRRFLQWVSGIGATVTAVLVGVPVLRAFFSPTFSPAPSENWVKVADDIALIESDVPIRVSFSENKADAWLETQQINSVWLYTEDGQKFKAYNAHCTHLGCAYGYDADTKTFACPCHRGQFDVKTGRVLAGPPPRPLDELGVQVRDDAVWVDYRDFRVGVPNQIEA
jgi:menaquinol-cytochrome c reductase iron-sulfur subunit